MSLDGCQAVPVNGSKSMKNFDFLPVRRQVGVLAVICDGHIEVFLYRAAGTLGDRAVAASESLSLMFFDRDMPDSGMVPLCVTVK